MSGKSVRDLWFLKDGGINQPGARANLIELETKFTLSKFCEGGKSLGESEADGDDALSE